MDGPPYMVTVIKGRKMYLHYKIRLQLKEYLNQTELNNIVRLEDNHLAMRNRSVYK